MGSQVPSERVAPDYTASDGLDAAKLVRIGGTVLDLWQSDILDDWLGRTPSGKWAAPSAGGSVPRQFIPAVEKGTQETLANGILAGYPVVDVKVNLYDGSYHPVDSSEASFKSATAIALKKGVLDASPVLLEPIDTVTVAAPE